MGPVLLLVFMPFYRLCLCLCWHILYKNIMFSLHLLCTSYYSIVKTVHQSIYTSHSIHQSPSLSIICNIMCV
jgi:hypothetical protein